MHVYVLLYDAGQETEGIHSLEVSGETLVLMFENSEDAERYAGLLEAQDFPVPTIEALEKDEVENFCLQSGYEARLVEAGFIPKKDEDRILLAPPESSRDVTNWNEESSEEDCTDSDQSDSNNSSLDDIKKRLEGLL